MHEIKRGKQVYVQNKLAISCKHVKKRKQPHARKAAREKSLTNWQQMYLYRLTMKVADMIYLSTTGAIIGAI